MGCEAQEQAEHTKAEQAVVDRKTKSRRKGKNWKKVSRSQGVFVNTLDILLTNGFTAVLLWVKNEAQSV
jgi:hypothetical protein